ncbi:MAG: alpha/beta hydrolase, partial [Gammaproteobacteria bacterium]
MVIARIEAIDMTRSSTMIPIRTRLSTSLVVLLGVLSAAHSWAADDGRREQFIDIGHARLNAFIWEAPGSEFETIIALPGSGSDVTRYQYIAPQLAATGYRVVALNQRGIMGSSGTLHGLTLHDYAADVAAVVDALGVERVQMVGWALGNRISRSVATDYPEKVASVTLIAAGGLVTPNTQPGELGALLGQPDLPVSEKIRLARRTLFSPQSSDALVQEFVAKLNYWDEGRAAQVAARQATDVEEYAAGGSSPMLIIQGLDDLTAPPQNGEIMKQRYGDRITLVNLEGA